MMASDLIALLQERVAEFGNKDVVLVQQTGPDSFKIVDVIDVTVLPGNADEDWLVIE